MVYGYLAFHVFLKNPRALVNRVCMVIFICMGTWSFSMCFIHNPHTSIETARLFSSIGAVGWASFSSLFLWFILAFTRRKEILKKKWFYPVIFGIPLFFIFIQTQGLIFESFTKQYFGWKPLYSQSVWPHLLYLYYLSFTLLGLYINVEFMKKTRNPNLKKQAKLIFISVLITLALGTDTDTILPLLNTHFFPTLGDTFVLISPFTEVS
ncbi:MAG: hypothetical protein GY950_26755, partial [bacterium]|nr:hypothetical protein [bacterium]